MIYIYSFWTTHFILIRSLVESLLDDFIKLLLVELARFIFVKLIKHLSVHFLQFLEIGILDLWVTPVDTLLEDGEGFWPVYQTILIFIGGLDDSLYGLLNSVLLVTIQWFVHLSIGALKITLGTHVHVDLLALQSLEILLCLHVGKCDGSVDLFLVEFFRALFEDDGIGEAQ